MRTLVVRTALAVALTAACNRGARTAPDGAQVAADGAVVSGMDAGVGMTPSGGLAVWTSYYDNGRTGANLRERALTTSNVNGERFGLLFSRQVQGQIYTQPLYMEGLEVPGRGRRNVVFVATEHNMVYAFDADDPAAAEPIWTVNAGPSVPTEMVSDGFCPDLQPEIGITATPVIDVATSTLYVEAKSLEGGRILHRLHALDLATGREKFNGPTEITATVPGAGEGSENGTLAFNPARHHSRPGILLDRGVVYLAFASHCDREPYHGWILGYDAASLRLRHTFVTTPDGGEGGIWQSGAGMSVDRDGDIYFVSGNGTFDPNAARPEMSNAFTRLRPMGDSMRVVDWFVPYNERALNARDFDLGSTGVLQVPGTELLVGGSKEGMLYVIDRAAMGHFNPAGDTQIVQRFLGGANTEYSNIHGTPVYYGGPTGQHIYIMAEEDHLKAFRLENNRFVETPAMQSEVRAGTGMPGGILSVSADGAAAGTAIIWSNMPVMEDANQNIVAGMVRAFDATTLRELWNSEQNPADRVGLYAKFVPVTVANGRAYVATFSNRLNVYGLR